MKFNTTMIDAQRVFDSIYKAGNPDPSKTLIAWQNRAINARNAILAVQDQVDAQERELNQIYKSQAVAELMQPTKDAMDQIVNEERDKLTAELDETLEGKREQYKAVAMSAPSEAQLRFLQALSYRDDLTPGEVSKIAAENADCHQFLRALKAIAKKGGVDSVIAPPTSEEVDEALENAREYGMDALRSLATPSSEMGYFHRAFFAAPGVGPAAQFSRLDNNIFTSVQAPAESEADGQDAG